MESSWVKCVLGRPSESWPFSITVKEQPQSKVCVCIFVFKLIVYSKINKSECEYIMTFI